MVESAAATRVRVFSSPLSVEECISLIGPIFAAAPQLQRKPLRLTRAIIGAEYALPLAGMTLLGPTGVWLLKPPMIPYSLRFRPDGDESLIVVDPAEGTHVDGSSTITAIFLLAIPLLIIGVVTRDLSRGPALLIDLAQVMIAAATLVWFIRRGRRVAIHMEEEDPLGDVIWEVFEAAERPDLVARALDGLHPVDILDHGRGAITYAGLATVGFGVMTVGALVKVSELQQAIGPLTTLLGLGLTVLTTSRCALYLARAVLPGADLRQERMKRVGERLEFWFLWTVVAVFFSVLIGL